MIEDGDAEGPEAAAEHEAPSLDVALQEVGYPFAGPAPEASDASADARRLDEFGAAVPAPEPALATPPQTELNKNAATIPNAIAPGIRDAQREPDRWPLNINHAEP